MKNEPKIYGLKTNNKLVYVGKTHVTNKDGELKKSGIQTIYTNSKLNKLLVKNDDVTIIPIQDTDIKNWYYDRNNEAHKKFVEGEKDLLNDPWILEGKNGYWEGKKRDNHTLNRLSESKYKSIIQYDKKGNLVKVWNSGKEVGIQVFKDYRVVNGRSESKIYRLIANNTIKNKFALNHYWFGYDEMMKHFNVIPKKINIDKIISIEKAKRSKSQKKRNIIIVYTVNKYSLSGELIKKYDSAIEAALDNKTSVSVIRKSCTNKRKSKDFIWKYGKKIHIKLNNEKENINLD